MIINTGQRTDIPAFYSEWFLNRIREGYVLVRNPYYPGQVTRYRLSPDVVDALVFCTKNPEPMLEKLPKLKGFRQFWHVTITPYGKEIEPNVPDKKQVLDSFKRLSKQVGKRAVAWRYDPIFLSEAYSMDYHMDSFERMAKELQGYTEQVIISFIDLYQKTKRNFPEVCTVKEEDQITLGKFCAECGRKYNMTIRTCMEGEKLAPYGVDVSGCMTKQVLERGIGTELSMPKKKGPREGCDCVLGNDIGMYNTCGHFCKYCYANYDTTVVVENRKRHNPRSPLLVGELLEGDVVVEARQQPYATGQMVLFS